MTSERAVIARVRPIVMARDGPCRVGRNLLSGLGPCEGVPEWAHLNRWRRCHTRGMAPEERHCTMGSVALCSRHHRLFDGNILGVTAQRLYIFELTDRGADGPLAFEIGDRRYEELETERR